MRRLSTFIAMLVIVITTSLIGCGGDGGGDTGGRTPAGNPPAPNNPTPNDDTGGELVEGVDFTGTYNLIGVECYDSATGQFLDVGIISGFTETVAIQGNSLSDTTSDGDCSETVTARVVFRENGTFSITNGRVSVPQGTCTIDGSVGVVDRNGNSTVLPTSATATHGDSFAFTSGQYLKNPTSGAVGIVPRFPVDPSPGTTCFWIYNRL